MATALASSVRTDPAQRRSPLVLWHLLSLDAPTVAACWTILFAMSYNVALPVVAPAALATAVWMLYAADRISDAAAGEFLQERHLFHFQQRRAFSIVWLLCVPILIAMVAALPRGLREAWLAMALPLGVYAGLIHGLRLSRFPKEPLVACFFAGATIMPVAVSALPLQSCIGSALLFGAACWINCAAIARWENTAAHALDAGTRYITRHFQLCAFLLILSGALQAALQRGTMRASTGVAAACSAALLLLLDSQRRGNSAVALRALADAALLTPLVVLPVCRLLQKS